MHIKRNRTPSKDIRYGLYLYFLGLSTRSVTKALSYLHIISISHVSILKWIQKNRPRRILSKGKKISEFIVYETVIKAGLESIWLWVAIEPENKQILALNISKERIMLIAERFISSLVQIHGKHPVSTDGGTWYPQACRFLNVDHHIHSSLEKSLIERTMQYIKDRTESFDDYFPCRKECCSLFHIKHWFILFAVMYNNEVLTA